ncbi:hypothetical protein MRX96_055158 [Rhipicephalus microplus]
MPLSAECIDAHTLLGAVKAIDDAPSVEENKVNGPRSPTHLLSCPGGLEDGPDLSHRPAANLTLHRQTDRTGPALPGWREEALREAGRRVVEAGYITVT